MHTLIRAAFAASLLITAASVAAGTFYKSIAPDGSVVYSDHPPADGKAETVQTQEFEDLPSSPVPDLPQSPADKAKATKRSAAPISSAGLVMYSATWCGQCKRAKAYLANRGIGYQDIDVDTPDGRSAFVVAGKGGVPLLVFGNKHIRGFSDAGYDRFFAPR